MILFEKIPTSQYPDILRFIQSFEYIEVFSLLIQLEAYIGCCLEPKEIAALNDYIQSKMKYEESKSMS